MSDQPQTQQLTKSDRIESAIDKSTTAGLSINRHGQVDFVNANEIMEFAKIMALAKQAIPPHLRDNPGGCMAVCIQASSWQMSPFAVANKSYVVNDRMAYEAQIIAAVILMRAPIKGRLKYTYQGADGTRRCTCTAILDDGEPVEYQTPEIRNIKIQNSPLWKNDPDQQLAYSAARSLARRHFPDVILGVYTPDEMAEETFRDVTPGKPTVHDTPALPAETTTVKPEPPKEKQPEKPAPAAPVVKDAPAPKKQAPAKKEATPVGNGEGGSATTAAAGATTPTPQATGTTNSAPEVTEEERKRLVDEVNERRDNADLSMSDFKAKVAELGIAEKRDMLPSYTAKQLQACIDRWQEFAPQQQEQESAS